MKRTSVVAPQAKALAIKDPDSMRAALIAEVAADWVRGVALAVRGDPPFDRPQRWAFRLVAEIAKLVGMPQTQMLAIVQRELGVDLEKAQLAVALWQDSVSMGDESKREVAEDWLSRYYRIPVGVLRDTLQRARDARLETVDPVPGPRPKPE